MCANRLAQLMLVRPLLKLLLPQALLQLRLLLLLLLQLHVHLLLPSLLLLRGAHGVLSLKQLQLLMQKLLLCLICWSDRRYRIEAVHTADGRSWSRSREGQTGKLCPRLQIALELL